MVDVEAPLQGKPAVLKSPGHVMVVLSACSIVTVAWISFGLAIDIPNSPGQTPSEVNRYGSATQKSKPEFVINSVGLEDFVEENVGAEVVEGVVSVGVVGGVGSVAVFGVVGSVGAVGSVGEGGSVGVVGSVGAVGLVGLVGGR